jgi:hypothetical protein
MPCEVDCMSYDTYFRLFFVAYIFVAVMAVSVVIANITNVLVDIEEEARHKRDLEKPFDVSKLLLIDQTSGAVDELAFVLFMLDEKFDLEMESDIMPWIQVGSEFSAVVYGRMQ